MEKKSVTEILQMHGKYVTPVVGTSMTPLLRQDRDVVVIVPKSGSLRRFDVPLYIRRDGTHVLHRVMGKNTRGYILCGDNQFVKEYGVTDEMVQGVMAGFFRGKRYFKTTAPGYRLYVFFWCRCFFIRKFCLRLRRLLRR